MTVDVHAIDGGGFYGEVRQLPGCITQTDTLEDLAEAIREAVRDYFAEPGLLTEQTARGLADIQGADAIPPGPYPLRRDYRPPAWWTEAHEDEQRCGRGRDHASAPRPVVQFADILFVDAVPDSVGGNPKGRRVVVLTPDDALAAGLPIVAAPVTSRIPPVPGPDHVVLPFRNPPGARHPVTGPTRRAGTVATWLVLVDPAAIAGYSGLVPPRVMAVVHARTAAAAQALGGWP